MSSFGDWVTTDAGTKKTVVPSLRGDVISVQREEIRELRSENERLSHLLAIAEGKVVLLQSIRESLADDLCTMYDVIRILAGQLTNGLAAPRKARAQARKMLESRGLDAPHTLGSSRCRKSEGKRA